MLIFIVSMSIRQFWWIHLYLNLLRYLPFYNLFHLVHGQVHDKGIKGVPANVTRSRKLRGTQYSPELAFRSTEFSSPENLIFSALDTQLFVILG